MIITISGDLGSGKSTVAKMLAKELRYKHYSTGDFWRTLAARRGLDVYEYNKLAENDSSIDQEIDSYSAELGKGEDNFIIDSRLAWHFIPHSFKVRLVVDPAEGAKRIYAQAQEENRGSEKQHQSIQEATTANRLRRESEKQRYLEIYKVDINEPKNFDLVVGTTNISTEEVAQQIINNLPKE